MKIYNNEPVIVSLTTHGLRLNHVSKTIFSILTGSFKNLHLVLAIFKNELDKIPEDLKLLVNNNLIELLVCDNDLGPHTKYFYTMLKYKTTPIITIDDDGIYDKDTVKSLYEMYQKHKDCICARRVHNIIFDNKKIKNYKQWILDYKNELKPSMQLLATGVGGVIYPPNILNISEKNLKEINDCLWADDIYLKVLQIRKNIKVIWVPNNQLQPQPFSKEIDKIVKKNALCQVNLFQNRNDIYINKFIDEFNKLR